MNTGPRVSAGLTCTGWLVAIGAFGLLWWICHFEPDGDIVDVQKYPSPDGRYVVTVFQKIFYNTTLYDRHVHLSGKGEELQYPGNVHVLPDGEGVTVSWTSTTNVSLILRFETPRIPSPTNVSGITVTFFRGVPPVNGND
jgi:hypothetical protein